MPQQHLLSDEPIWRQVEVITDDLTLDLQDAWQITVRVRAADDETRTLYVGKWSGYMLDLYPTLLQEAATAFMFGTVGDVIQRCQATERQARQHARSHDRVGS